LSSIKTKKEIESIRASCIEKTGNSKKEHMQIIMYLIMELMLYLRLGVPHGRKPLRRREITLGSPDSKAKKY
jgi:hypothetical protein